MRRLALAALPLVAAACVSTNAVRLGGAEVAPRANLRPEQIAVYRTAAAVPGKYVEVALLNSSGESSWTDQPAMVNSMRRKAAKLGANAILLDDIKEASAGAKIAAAVLKTGSERQGRAVAIYVYYPDGAATAATAAAPNGTPPAGPASGTESPAPLMRVVTAAATDGGGRVAADTAVSVSLTGSRYAQASIGAPRSETSRVAAAVAFKAGSADMGAHRWEDAAENFRQAIRLDGSVAAYHAALGAVLMIGERWADAEAEYTAALLIDVDNAEYRAKVKEARSRQ